MGSNEDALVLTVIDICQFIENDISKKLECSVELHAPPQILKVLPC
jgi:hypothetical protein